jgi:hypothetical protein
MEDKEFRKFISEIAYDIAEAEVQVNASRVPLKQNKKNFEIRYVDMASLKSSRAAKPSDPNDPKTPKTPTSSNDLEDRARKIANKLSMEAEDFIKKVTFTKKRVAGSDSKGYNILFQIDFDSTKVAKFVGLVSIPNSEKLKPADGTTGKDFQGSAFGKTTTGSERGTNLKLLNKDNVDRVYEASKDENIIVAGVVDGNNRFTKLENVDWIQASTKTEIKNFLRDLGSLELRESNNNNKMRNEKEFKKRISEMASRIADEMSDDMDKKEVDEAKETGFKASFEKLKPNLATAIRSVKADEDLAYLIMSMIELMPMLAKNNTEAKSGVRLALQALGTDPAVSKKNPNAMYDKMPMPKKSASKEPEEVDLPALQEAFNRINRK